MFGQGKQRRSFGVMVDAFPKYLVSKFPQTEEVEARHCYFDRYQTSETVHNGSTASRIYDIN